MKKSLIFIFTFLFSNNIFADEFPLIIGLSLGQAIGIAEAQNIISSNLNIDIKNFSKECTIFINKNEYLKNKPQSDKEYSIGFCIKELEKLKAR